MPKRRSKKKKTKKKEQLVDKKRICKILVLIIMLCSSILYLNYIIWNSKFLQPVVDEKTINYISFNNKDATDCLKINNIEKLRDKRGKGHFNKKRLIFKVTGEEKINYDIVIYPIINKIDLKYIKYYLTNDLETSYNTLSSMPKSEDGGIIIYQNNLKNKKLTLRMWVDKKYSGKISNSSYEVKIKQR